MGNGGYMALFRKKPVVIEAIQLRDDTREELLATFVPNHQTPLIIFTDGEGHVAWAEIETLEGTHKAEMGDYIICGVKGELWPCKPDIVAATYDAVEG